MNKNKLHKELKSTLNIQDWSETFAESRFECNKRNEVNNIHGDFYCYILILFTRPMSSSYLESISLFSFAKSYSSCLRFIFLKSCIVSRFHELSQVFILKKITDNFDLCSFLSLDLSPAILTYAYVKGSFV